METSHEYSGQGRCINVKVYNRRQLLELLFTTRYKQLVTLKSGKARLDFAIKHLKKSLQMSGISKICVTCIRVHLKICLSDTKKYSSELTFKEQPNEHNQSVGQKVLI